MIEIVALNDGKSIWLGAPAPCEVVHRERPPGFFAESEGQLSLVVDDVDGPAQVERQRLLVVADAVDVAWRPRLLRERLRHRLARIERAGRACGPAGEQRAGPEPADCDADERGSVPAPAQESECHDTRRGERQHHRKRAGTYE